MHSERGGATRNGGRGEDQRTLQLLLQLMIWMNERTQAVLRRQCGASPLLCFVVDGELETESCSFDTIIKNVALASYVSRSTESEHELPLGAPRNA